MATPLLPTLNTNDNTKYSSATLSPAAWLIHRALKRHHRSARIINSTLYTPSISPLANPAPRLKDPNTAGPTTALDKCLAQLALASAHLLRSGSTTATSSLRAKLWYFASGSWSAERWDRAVRAKLPTYLGVEVEERRAGEAMRKALRELRADGKSSEGEGGDCEEDGGGNGEYWRDARDLERIVREWVGGM